MQLLLLLLPCLRPLRMHAVYVKKRWRQAAWRRDNPHNTYQSFSQVWQTADIPGKGSHAAVLTVHYELALSRTAALNAHLLGCLTLRQGFSVAVCSVLSLPHQLYHLAELYCCCEQPAQG